MTGRLLAGIVTAALFMVLGPTADAQVLRKGIFASLSREMRRNIDKLRLPGAPRPYFFGVLYRRNEGWSQTGSLGRVFRLGRWRSASLSGTIRIGSYEQDDTNYFGPYPSGGSAGASWDGDDLGLRRGAHNVWDSAFKRAVQNYSRKQAYLADHPKAKRCDDWSRARVQTWTRRVQMTPLDPTQVRRAILASSKVFLRHPKILGSGVSVGQNKAETFLLTSEGLRVREQGGAATVAVVAAGRAPDGQWYSIQWSKTFRPDGRGLGSLKLVSRARKVAGRLERILAAPVLEENFTGPVLIEGSAAAYLWSAFVGKGLRADMPAVTWSGGRMLFEGMKGRKILPDSVTIVDDPTVARYRGQPLYGSYEVDDEGVAAQRLILVEHGKLRTFLASRRPSVETKASNGHGRTLSGLSLNPVPNGSNVFIKVRRPLSARALKARYLKLLRKEGVNHGYVIRSFGGNGLSVRGFWGAVTSSSVPVPAPLEVFRIDASGRETLVRKVRVEPIQMADFASIPAIGGAEQVVTVLDWSGRGVSLVYRNFIVSRMSLTRPAATQQRLPLLPSPLSRLLSAAK